MRIDINGSYGLRERIARKKPSGKIGSLLQTTARKTPLFNRFDRTHPTLIRVPGTDQPGIIDVPIFSVARVPASYCARYVRFAAKQLFGIEFTPANAWDMKYADTVVSNPSDMVFDPSYLSGHANIGAAVGMRWPRSRHNTGTDLEGEPIEYTHVGLYIGDDYEVGTPLVAHLFGSQTRVDSANELLRRGLTPVDVIEASSRIAA